MRQLLLIVVLSGYACASAGNVYFVSSSAGNDSYTATQAQNPATPWKTLTKVNAFTFAAGDRVLLARGDVWREQLAPLSSGITNVPIAFDAYGTGAAPEITGYQALSGWTQVAGYTNQWKVPLTAPAMNYVLFGTIWGTKQTTQSALAHDRDFFLLSNFLYVYAPSDPSAYYGTVAAMLMSSTPLISISGRSWLTFQHIRLDYFDQYGVSVTGVSDHLVFANMEVDGMIPAGSFPVGFYVNASSPGDIKFYNDSAHMNYDGFRVDGTATAVVLENCAGYANRDTAVSDNTSGHVTYSYSHFYANGTGGIESSDVVGAVLGTGNLAADTAPNVEGFARYPARLSFTVDDVGLYAASDTFVDALIPVFNARGLSMNAAIVTGPTGVTYSTANVASWVAGGHEVDSHSWSHQYFTDPQYLSTNHIYNSTNPTAATAFSLKYVGAGTAATATMSGGVLSTNVTGGPGGQNLNINLANASYDTLGELTSYITSNYAGAYTVTNSTTPLMRVAAHSNTLATFSGQDIKTAAYGLQFAIPGLMTDEAQQSRSWLQSNIAGLSNVKVYVYPDGVTDPTFEAAVAAAGYEGARGTLSMCGSGAAPCSGQNAFVSHATGVNAQNITSLTPVAWTNYSSLTEAQLDAKVGALLFKMRVWGYPVGLFVHANDYPDAGTAATKTGWLLDSIAAHGGTVSRNDALVETLLAMQSISGTTKYVSAATGEGLSLRPTPGGPGIGKGKNEGSGYGWDLAGAMRPSGSGWDIGAYQILWTKQGGASGSGHFLMGEGAGVAGENAYCTAGDVAHFGSMDGPATLPQQCVYTAMAGSPSPGAVTTVAADCSNLQSVINAAAAGDTIVIPAAATCTGNYTFAAKSGADRNHWITVRTSAISDPNFPAEGVQATPCQINLTHIDGYPDYPCAVPAVRMPTLSSATVNTSPVTVAGDFYRIIGLNITKNYGTAIANQLVNLAGTDHVILDRCLIHGDNWDQHTPNFDTHVGLYTKGTYQALINSWIYDIDWNSADGYAIGGGTGSQPDEGPTKIYNNLIAGGSESFIFGGGFAVAWPHDFEIRRNLSMKPWKWMQAFGAGNFPNYVNIKNLGEYKHGHRVLMEDNVLTNLWEGQADQFGYAMVILPKNQASTNTSKFANTNGTAVSCAKDAAGTPCDAHTGQWGNQIVSLSRTSGVVTVLASKDAGFPAYNAGGSVVLQGIPSQMVNGVNLNSFNGEHVMGCLPDGIMCVDGFTSNASCTNNCPIYFASPGPDFATTATSGLAQDFTASTCAVTKHCHIAVPKGNYSLIRIASVVDSEHVATLEDMGVQTGQTQQSCHPGQAPNAQVQDFTARYNYITHSENVGFNIGNVSGPCLDLTRGVSKISIHDNLADDIDVVGHIQGAASGHGGTGPIITNTYMDTTLNPHDISIVHNTWAGLRGYASMYFSSGGVEIGDAFNTVYQALTLERVSNVITVTFAAASGVPQYQYVTLAGFTGGNASLNGQQTVTFYTSTSVQFTNAGADITPAVTLTGSETVSLYPMSYFANVTIRDNIFDGPVRVTNHAQALLTSISTGFSQNLCQGATCTWLYKNNIVATDPHTVATDGQNYAKPSAGYLSSYPTSNPDSSPVCTIASGCAVSNLSSVFTSWGAGIGDTRANNYQVTAAYRGMALDGKDPGADIQRINMVRTAVLPSFTYRPLTIATTSLTPCTHNVYCEQQLLISSGASGALGYVQWHIVSGTLPTGMSLATFDQSSAGDCKVNGDWKSGAPYTGCAGWIWGTPTQAGSFPVTFEAEDAGHQQATVNLTLVVN